MRFLFGKCFVQGFGAGLHMKFVVDAVYVFLDRLLADKELSCDLFVKITLSGNILLYSQFQDDPGALVAFNVEIPAYAFHAGPHIFYPIAEPVQVSIRYPFSVITYDHIQFIIDHDKFQLGLRCLCMLQDVVQGFFYRVKDIPPMLPVDGRW